MNLRFVFAVILTCAINVSSRQIESAPARFDRERYVRSRNRPKEKPLDPINNYEKTLDFVATVNAYGYPAEEHNLTTIDGYKLRIHRIPGNSSSPLANGKPVVFMQHGMIAASDSWVLMGPSKDLAYMLADLGFDVWFGNARGNTYSRNHESLSPDYNRDFWRYSFHEMALYDVTAAIDYILQQTNQHQVAVYIGHSMGTTISYILLSEKPEYNDKIKLVISMSPAAIWRNTPNKLINFMLKHIDILNKFFENAQIYEFLPLTTDIIEFSKILCSDDSTYKKLCIEMQDLIYGSNPKQLNASLLPYLFNYYPAGCSVQTINHYGQIILSGDFKMYDYGIIENFQIYKQKTPPFYNLSNIIAPVVIFYSKGDTITPPKGVIELSKKLPNVLTVEKVPDDKFTHFNFVFARDIKTLLNDRVVQIVENTLMTSKNKKLL